jgi:hypothetical protein
LRNSQKLILKNLVPSTENKKGLGTAAPEYTELFLFGLSFNGSLLSFEKKTTSKQFAIALIHENVGGQGL